MKIIEIMGGLRIPMSNEETDLTNKVKSHQVSEVKQLSDREKQVLLGLIHKNIVNIDGVKLSFNGLQESEGLIWK